MKPYDRSLLEIFATEQGEHLQRLRTLVAALAEGPAEARASALEEILRRAHTLKGAARAVGLEATESILHRMEGLLSGVRDSGANLDPNAAAALNHGLDAMEDVLASALSGRTEPETATVIQELDQRIAGVPEAPEEAAPASAPVLPAVPVAELIRVDASKVDELIRTSSQMVSATSAESVAYRRAEELLHRASQVVEEFRRLRRECSAYLRTHESAAELHPIRDCLEYADNQLKALHTEARAAAEAKRARAWEMRIRSAELHRQAVQIRMVPADVVFGAFGAMVREIARDEGKEVEFRAEGMEVQGDRLVLQTLKDPVMHLLRNAVSHGIELPEEREAAGKPRAGTIRLRINSRGSRLNVTVEDDGRGLDLAAIGERAVEHGLLTREALAGQTRDQLARWIFRPGLSTSKAITSLSGRGMGLPIVEETVNQLQGEIHVLPRRGNGLRITLTVGLSISTQHVLLLAAGGYTFGIATQFAERLLRVPPSELETAAGRPVILVESKAVPVANLLTVLGMEARPGHRKEAGNEGMASIVVLAVGEQRAGLMVDRFLDDREAVVKELGLPPGSRLAAGGVPLEDGTVAVLLNPFSLFERFRSAKTVAPQETESAPAPAQRILVVDDSVTTRSLEKSILEAHGYLVSVAVDGVEALEKLRSEKIDLVITDVMMPRMDGLQLVEEMKKQRETEKIPVIIVSSLERREDQQRGLALGADAYIGKRKFDQRYLLDTVRQIL